MNCWICGQAPGARWVRHQWACNKKAHDLSRKNAILLRTAQRRARLEAETSKRKEAFAAIKLWFDKVTA